VKPGAAGHDNFARTQPLQQPKPEVNSQEENEKLLTKIKGELVMQMSTNFAKIENEITEIKTRQSAMSTIDTRKDSDQRHLADSIQKPAEQLN